LQRTRKQLVCDVLGKSGRAMIEALIAGESDPIKLARFADRRVKASQENLLRLRGTTAGCGPAIAYALGRNALDRNCQQPTFQA